jgi:hypothetical protein
MPVGFNLPQVTRTNIREGAHPIADAGHDEHEALAKEERLEHPADDVHEISQLGDASGLGDLTIYSQYRFIGANDTRLHASTLLGLKAPTGTTDVVSDEGHRIESEHQPGSGSWDVLAGLAVTRQWTSVTLDSSILYSFAGDGSQDSNLGDVFSFDGPTDRREPKPHPTRSEISAVCRREHRSRKVDLNFADDGDWIDSLHSTRTPEIRSTGRAHPRATTRAA